MAPLQDPTVSLLPPHAVPAEGPTDPAGKASAGRFGWLPAVYFAVFAGLLASFPAQNSDLWGHLAAGRDLAHGQQPLGGAAAPTPWLYDLATYGLYSVLGGRGLVACKVLLVVGLGLVLLRLCGSRGWLATACTALALLAMSTRLLLQPATVSYFFLALTLLVLMPNAARGPRTEGEGEDSSALRILWLIPLFVAWVNLDSWFLLGLATVALVEVGRVLDQPAAGGARLRALRHRALAFGLLAAACLLNPAHVDAFLHHPILGGPAASGPVTSPFQQAYWTIFGLSPAGLAYFPLLVLGVISFPANQPGWRWQRWLPWIGLAVFSALQVRAIPFFAVVAGPVLALNLREFLARRAAREGLETESEEAIRNPWSFALYPLALVLLVCAWPGWLQGPPFEPRRWDAELPPAVVRGAAAARHWHEEGKVGPDQRGLHLAAATANAFAWFCPEDNGLRDEGLTAALLGAPGAPEDWERRLRAARVDHVVVYNAGLDRFWDDPGQWPLLYLEGGLAIFGWRDPGVDAKSDPFRSREVDLGRLAFRPAADKRAPRKRPAQEPEARAWWEAFWKPAPPPPPDRGEAEQHFRHADALGKSAVYRHVAGWNFSQSAGLVAAAAGWVGPGALFDANLRLTLVQPPRAQPGAGEGELPLFSGLALKCFQWAAQEQDDMPPALLYLAVRAARRALAANPDDAHAYLVLGKSYIGLLYGTRERAWGQRLPRLVELRRVQASQALNQAVALKPDLAEAHLLLVGLYQEMGFRDLMLHHVQTYLKLTERTGAEARDPAAAGSASPPPRPYELEADRLALAVAAAENAYAERAEKMRIYDRAMLAMERGLAGKARDLLLATDLAAFGQPGMVLELELLLRTGRAKDVREWTEPEQKGLLGAAAYHWLRARALAASGDYAEADGECTELVASARGSDPLGPRETVALLVAQAVLDQQTGTATLPDLAWRAQRGFDFRRRLASVVYRLAQEADALVLRGLLALEAGDVDDAEVAFRLALLSWRDEAAAAGGGGIDFGGRVVAQECLKWLAEGEDKGAR
jgi:hypothetical protein